MQGPLRVTCMTGGSWKESRPTCICPACLGGRNCDQPLTWKAALKAMHETYMEPSGVSLEHNLRDFTCTASYNARHEL